MKYLINLIKVFAILILVILISLLLIFEIIATNTFGLRAYLVPTESMEPAIPKNSLVIIKEDYDYDKIQVGDVIVYQRNSDGLPIIHRVLSIQDDKIETKGDNNPSTDGFCTTKDNFKGKEIITLPQIGNYIHNKTVENSNF